MSILYRLLSTLGAVAHLPDAAIGKATRRYVPGEPPRAGAARFAMPAIIGVPCVLLFVAAVATWTEAAANPYPVERTPGSLREAGDVHGRNWATFSGRLYGVYVEYERFGEYDSTDYFLCDADGRDCIVVVSDTREWVMYEMAGSDGSIVITGMLREDPDEVRSTVSFLLPSELNGMDVNRNFILVDGQRPADARSMAALAIVTGGLGAPFLIGWMVGYLVFRPSPRQPQPGRGMAGPLGVRVTGLLAGPGGGVRAREMAAELRPGEMPPGAAEAGWAPPVDLWWRHDFGYIAVRLTPSLSDAIAGCSYPAAGERPALRARFAGFKLILEFESEATRDAAYSQLLWSTLYGLPPSSMLPWPWYGTLPWYGSPQPPGYPAQVGSWGPWNSGQGAPGGGDPGATPPET
jgi:hypothetical protein